MRQCKDCGKDIPTRGQIRCNPCRNKRDATSTDFDLCLRSCNGDVEMAKSKHAEMRFHKKRIAG